MILAISKIGSKQVLNLENKLPKNLFRTFGTRY
jgi:hypothetical protein